MKKFSIIIILVLCFVVTGCGSRNEAKGIDSVVAIAVPQRTSTPEPSPSATPFVSDYKEDNISRDESLLFDVPLVRAGLPEEPDWSSFEDDQSLKSFCADMTIPESLVNAFEKTSENKNLESIFFLSSNGGYFQMQKKDNLYFFIIGTKDFKIDTSNKEVWGQGFFQNEKKLVLVSVTENAIQRQTFSFTGRVGSYVYEEPLYTYFK